jgi:UDP-glucuronate 4-epimerase
MRVLVTGSAGFIGAAVALKLLERGDDVIGIDNLNPYYDPALKRARLARLTPHRRYTHVAGDIADRAAMERTFAEHKPQSVVNLAAQAGVRYAAQNPHAYVASNVTGFLHVLEGCRAHAVEHLVYASTSSVYGANAKLPFEETDATEHPLTLYAATKKANEMMAHSYAHLYSLPCTGLRFFTVYGPWGRPDMSYFQFARAIERGEPIKLFNEGRHTRDFTYVDDIVEGVVRVLDRPPRPSGAWDPLRPDPSASQAPYRLYNIGNQTQVELVYFIELIERAMGRNSPGPRELLPLQPGDVPDTRASVDALMRDTGYNPSTPVETGVANFVEWYRAYAAGKF